MVPVLIQDYRYYDLSFALTGEYKLKADAAYACDKAATLLQVETLANFSTWEEYKETQQNELDTTKCSFADAMPSLEIATQVYDNLLHRMKNHHVSITEKCMQNGKVLSDDYKSHIHNILNGKDDRNEECSDDDVHEEAEDIASIHSDDRGEEDSDEDDDASLFSDSSQMTPQGYL
jgi:hypothetical protein